MSVPTTFPVTPSSIFRCVGDSMTKGGVSGVGGVSIPWQAGVVAEWNRDFTIQDGCRCRNNGYPTMQTEQGLIGGQYSHWDGNALLWALGGPDPVPTHIPLLFGRNDAAGGINPNTSAASMASGMAKVWAVHPTIFFPVVSCIENGEQHAGSNPFDAALDANAAACAAMVETLAAAGKPCCWVDVRTPFQARTLIYNPGNIVSLGIPPFRTVDGLHLNGTGANECSADFWGHAVFSL